MQILNERNDFVVKSMIKKIYNDSELGYELRKIFRQDSLIKKFPNDAELGREIRKIYQSEEYK